MGPQLHKFPQPAFQELVAPDNALVVADLAHCRGFAHCPSTHRTNGFWLAPEVRDMPKEEVFCDYEALINALGDCFPCARL